MNFLDIIIMAILLFFLIRGFIRGFIIELGILCALILGAWAAFHFSDVLRSLLMEYMGMKSSYIPALALTLTFILVFIIVFLVAKLLTQMVKASGLGFLNKSAGAIFGGLKAMVLISILFYIINGFDKKEKILSPKTKTGSSLYKPVSSVVPKLLKLTGTRSLPGFPQNTEAETDTVFLHPH